MTDSAFLLEVLSDGQPHTLTEILSRSFRERGVGLTVHSRAASLRKQGYVIINERVPGQARGRGSSYRLVLLEADATHDAGDGAVADPSASASGRTLRRTQEALEPSPASLGASAPSRPAGAPCSSPAGEVPSGASPVSQLALDIQVRRVA